MRRGLLLAATVFLLPAQAHAGSDDSWTVVPSPCGIASPSYHDCQNMKEVGGGMDGERYWCAICSKGFYLDYEEMK